MKHIFKLLILVSVFTVFVNVTAVMAVTADLIPWLIFTYGIPGYAVFCIVGGFIYYLTSKDQ